MCRAASRQSIADGLCRGGARQRAAPCASAAAAVGSGGTRSLRAARSDAGPGGGLARHERSRSRASARSRGRCAGRCGGSHRRGGRAGRGCGRRPKLSLDDHRHRRPRPARRHPWGIRGTVGAGEGPQGRSQCGADRPARAGRCRASRGAASKPGLLRRDGRAADRGAGNRAVGRAGREPGQSISVRKRRAAGTWCGGGGGSG